MAMVKPGVVKGSAQDRLEIQSYDPSRRARSRTLLGLFWILTLAVALAAGWFSSLSQLQSLTDERDHLRQQQADSERAMADMLQRLGVLETGGEIDRQAAETVRETLIELSDQVDALEEEISFYKGIMDPGSRTEGLNIARVRLSPDAREVSYSVLLTQVGSRGRAIAGVLQAELVGRNEEGAAIVMPLSALDATVPEAGQSFRFRYYQEVGGRFELPANFQPVELKMMARVSGSRSGSVEHTTPWPN